MFFSVYIALYAGRQRVDPQLKNELLSLVRAEQLHKWELNMQVSSTARIQGVESGTQHRGGICDSQSACNSDGRGMVGGLLEKLLGSFGNLSFDTI